MAFIFEDQPATGAPNSAPRFIFEDDQQAQQPVATNAERLVFEDAAAVPAPAPKRKGILEGAADIVIGAGARIAQGVNEGLGAINEGLGLDSTIYQEGAGYWGKKAEDAGSTGLPAKIYQGIGASPAGVAEFMAGPIYAGAKGGLTGYRENGVPGAMEKAAIEVGKRLAIGKIFHGIENTAISGMTKAGAMGGTMGVQTAAEQAMTPEGIQAEDVAASAITGTLLSVQPGGRSEPVRRNLIKEGVQPEIAADLAGRVQESPRFVAEEVTPETGRTEIQFTDPQGKPIDVPLDTRPPEAVGSLISETGAGNLRITPDIALEQPRILADSAKAPEMTVRAPIETTPAPKGESQREGAEIQTEQPLSFRTQADFEKELSDAHIKGELTPGFVIEKMKGISEQQAPAIPERPLQDSSFAGQYVFEDSITDIKPSAPPSGPVASESFSVNFHPDKRVELKFTEAPDPKIVNRLQANRFEDQGNGSWIAKGDGKIRRAFVEKLQGELSEKRTLPREEVPILEISEIDATPSYEIEPYNSTVYRGVADRDPLHSGGMGRGTYYSSDRDIARSYAEDFSEKPGHVLTEKVTLVKPFYAEKLEDVFRVLPDSDLQTRKGESLNDAEMRQQQQITELLSSQGFDGIVLRNSLNPRTGDYVKADEILKFPAQKTTITPLETQFPDTARTESARHAAADTLNQVYPEGSPDIGLAVKPGVARDDTVTIPQGHKDTAGNFTSADLRVERRWKEANGLNEGPGLIERGKAFIHRMLSETQHFPELDTTSFAGKRTADVLRRFESSPAAAKAKTAEYLHSLTATFGPKKMDTFTRKVILDDLMNEAEKGRELPFGYTVETLKKDHAAVSAIAESHPDIKAALDRRADVNKALVMDLVDNGLLPVESVLKPEALERYQKSGKFEADDINTGYFRHQVLEHANARKWAGVSATGDVRNKQRGWQKGRQGSEKDINTNFLEAEFEVFSQSMKELATKKALDETLRLNDITPELKAQAKKEGIEDWKTLIPEGHTAWQPEKGSIFYRGQTMPEQIVARFIEENPNFADVASKFREATILGGKKAEVIIPEGLAKTLDSLRTNRDTATLDTINQKMIGAWKVWTLLSPRRAIKYNLNNMSGDMDVAIAADPAIISRHFNTAWKNGLNRKAGRPMSKDEIDMLDRGVIDSGISINEIPDISKLPGFSHLKEAYRQAKLVTALRSGDLSKLAPSNLIAKYFDVVSGLTQLREGLLREAAYLRAKELLDQGKKVYWASKPAEIDALPNIKDKAAKLSRELVGDYGNLSAHGEKIRSRFIPFWSWMEINSPRYYRLFKNAAAQGEAGSTAARMAGVGGRKVAGATLGIAEKVLLTQVLFASVSAFNHLVHPEEEERLGDADRKQLHIILGTGSDGKVMTARFQGAFSDALSWFGLENYTEILRNLKDGKMEPGELARKMLMATPNKLVNATSPFFKMGAELITGKSFYPDITKPTPIRDKVEHAARFLSLDNEYKTLAGKPTRGYLDSLKGLYLYETDPGEAAYQTIRKLAFKHLEKGGKEAISSEPTTRSNALYYYKQAIRYGDEEAAQKYKAEYLEKGGTLAGIQKSIARAHPMATLPLNQRAKFRQSLSAKEVETLKHAIEWYRQVYQP